MATPLLTRVKAALAIHAGRPTRGLLEGQYGSVHKGRSLDFDDLREYVPGDDVKDLDWKATARSAHPLVKRFVALRRHTILLVVATGRDLAALSAPDTTKRDVAILAAGIVGWVAVRHGDVVALVAGDESGVRYTRAGGTALHLEQLLRSIERRTAADGAGGDLTATLDFVSRHVRHRTILVLIDDSPSLDEEQLGLLRRLVVQHEVLRIRVSDLAATDPQIASRRAVDVGSLRGVPEYLRRDAALRAQVSRASADADAGTARELRRLGIAAVELARPAEAVGAIFRLLERHRRARV